MLTDYPVRYTSPEVREALRILESVYYTQPSIVALAQTALAAERRDLALEVFAAADCPGLQRAYLAARCLELTGQPPPRRHLRAAR